MATMVQISCENTHRANASIPDGQTLQVFLKNNTCKKCGTSLHLVGFPDES